MVLFVHLSIPPTQGYGAPSRVKLCCDQRQNLYLHLERTRSNVVVGDRGCSISGQNQQAQDTCLHISGRHLYQNAEEVP